MSVPPTGTVTFLFTDIQGSTMLWEKHPDEMRPALARHDQLLHQAITDNNGFVFKTVGDAFCAAFPTAPDAVQAALSAQQAMAAQAWSLPAPLLVRMALHTGVADERGGDYFGQPLSRVARLMAAGHGGQTLLSGATQELTRDYLPEAMTLRDLGERRLKDLGRPEHVYQAVHPSLAADFPPLRSLDNPDLPNNLPQQATSFIGRDKETAEIKRLLENTRLLTLAGAGGAGKSRLSLQVAADLLDQHFDGVWLVELAPLSDPALVAQAVAGVLGVPEQAGKTLQQSLVEWLRPKRLLLILDNCEHLVAACASLAADLLRGCPNVRILTSSREPLSVVGEQTYRVPSLSRPDPKAALSLDTLSQYEAVRLFIARAEAARPAFAVTDANAPALAQVCWTLDGIPLAIELAAARVRVLSVEEINTRLEDSFKLLTGGSRTLMPRQQTLRALIDWSYDLLTDPEKALLRRLSVFAGGWTLSAAEIVCPSGPVEHFEVLDLLTSLVDKSLAVYEEESSVGRYRLLETVRQYARDRLGESGEAEAVQERAAAWALALAKEAKPFQVGPDQALRLARLEADHDNLRASLSWYERQPASASALGAAGGTQNFLNLAAELWWFWHIHGHYSEGRQWLGRALAGGGADEAASATRVWALLGSGVMADVLGNYAEARARYEESLTGARQLDDQQCVAYALGNLGNIAMYQGDYAEAQRLVVEILAIQRGLGDRWGIAMSLGHLGSVAFCQGRHAEAQMLMEESLTIQRELGDRLGVAHTLNALGMVAADRSDYVRARMLVQAGLTLLRQLGNVQGTGDALLNLGIVAVGQGDYTEAWTLLAEGLTRLGQQGNVTGIAQCLEEMAGLANAQGSPARAARLWGASAALREAIGSTLTPSERARRDGAAVAARRAMGEDTFAAAFAGGQAMTREQAIDYALAQE